MKSSIKNLFIFAAGAVIGSAVTWKLVKTKYEHIAQEEIDSVKEVFGRRLKESDSSEEEENEDEEYDPTEEEKAAYDGIIDKNGYRNYSAKKEEVNDEMNKPYVISPDEFDENGYETETLTYYADNVLTDEYDNIIEDIEGTVGSESLTHFGEYEEDSVFVRNDERGIDYEILLDVRKYSDVYPY